MEDKALRRQCQDIVDTIDIPDPFDIGELVQLLGRRRDRSVRLVPMRPPPGSPCGVLVATRDFDVILFEADTSPVHQEHIIGHELGHLLCGHGAASTFDAAMSRYLLPDLDPQLVRRMLTRTDYSAREERQAEVFASLLSRAVNRRETPRPWVAPPDLADVFARLGQTLEHPPRDQTHGSHG